jgi:nanoRNase/pAp phosphatase (c-di-AMP/oligoRNAs hydrolase)
MTGLVPADTNSEEAVLPLPVRMVFVFRRGPPMSQKYRLVTRSDFDGLVCAVLFNELDMIDDIAFVHPKDMQDGKIEITSRDITTNLPYVPGCHLAFDHHSSESERNEGAPADNHIIIDTVESAARVVYEHFGGADRFPHVQLDMMDAVDQCDAAKFDENDILRPQGWVLLNFLMDPRTGLGRFRDFRVSNRDLMMQLIEHCRTRSIDQILELPDVKERVELYTEQAARAISQINHCTKQHDNLVILDLRKEETIFVTNRFMIYALFPQCNVSMHVIWGLKKQNTVFALGKSILNRSCTADIGALALKYGGGGHANAGTCQVPNDQVEQVQGELIDALTRATAATC